MLANLSGDNGIALGHGINLLTDELRQQFFYDERYADTSLEVSPDYVKLADAYGAVGLRATRPEEVRPVLEQAMRLRRPVVIDFVVKMMENVFPMIPSGGSIKDMLLA
jgi:acetolactate synthase-1/2/3 large subunit